MSMHTPPTAVSRFPMLRRISVAYISHARVVYVGGRASDLNNVTYSVDFNTAAVDVDEDMLELCWRLCFQLDVATPVSAHIPVLKPFVRLKLA